MSRILTNGFEFPTLAQNGVFSASGGQSISTDGPHLTPATSGGARHINNFSGGATELTLLEIPVHTEVYARLYMKYYNIADKMFFRIRDSSSGIMYEVFLNNATFNLEVYTGDHSTGTLRITSTSVLTLSQWYRVELYYLVAGSGTLTLRIDGVEEGTFSGVTNAVAASADQLSLGSSAASDHMDDLAVNTTWQVVYYDGGNGTPPDLGDTLTGASGSGEVMYHLGNGTTGIIHVDVASGTFDNNDALSSDSGFTGVENGDAIQTNVDWPGEGYIKLLAPTAAGSTTDLDVTGAGSNYQAVDDLEGTADYVSSTTEEYDLYAETDLPSDAVVVKHVQYAAHARKDGTGLDYLTARLKSGGTQYDAPYNIAQSTDWSWQVIEIPLNPNTLAPWSVAEINAIEAGPSLKATA